MTRGVDELIESFGIPKLSTTPHGYKGCCTINHNHIDSSPSMHIHIEKGLVKCFSCGAFKPLFSFLLDNGATFDEAIEFLFLDHYADREVSGELTEYILGRKFPKSFIDRGFTKETLKHFSVGFDEVERRTTIPLRYPHKGKLFGVQYRAYPKKFWATEGFNKDNFIYNFEPTSIRYYVEGFTDTWRTWQNGTKNVSATLSANPSVGQLEIMKQHDEIRIAFDNDVAGLRGAFAIHEALGREVEISMIPYNAKDPGDCTKSVWEKGLDSMMSFTEFEVNLINKNRKLYEEIKNGTSRGNNSIGY